MRIVKEHDDRRNEILDTAEKLFYVKGYGRCTVNDILTAIGIAKGTFYHYFTSKEEVLDSIVARYTEMIINRVNGILAASDISLEEKLMGMFMAMKITNPIDSEMLDDMHKVENVLLHQKMLNQIVMAMAPLLAMVVDEGVGKGVWNCRYPLQYMQIFLASSLSLTDEGIFALDGESQMKIMAALISLLEKMLQAPEDSFMQMLMQAQE
ncbi:TetR/AcrR family transcriptional regulator [Sphaerochaeta sp. PS]|uniref:TetR/AcrR family transcriptional regulator n=1 Tax=Sphaerochaeta sp. PS TaxID=3076336 RepID=UPI0028A44457|nr:TetR/AcrR family transcriptional regulator [Sphaerochaeta sp. PS]MDT4761146.1 TetR/AcrR family transcriptional regulator [Sphaerochaeta sp. PS]